MRSFHFQIKGLTREELLRRRDDSRRQHSNVLNPYAPAARQPAGFVKRLWNSLSAAAHALVMAILVVTGTAGLQWVYEVANGENVPTALVDGQVFTARNVIILQDTSGSMGGTDARLQALLRTLQRAGINTDRVSETKGYGFWPGGDQTNSLKSLERALDGESGVDTIFVFSDFNYYDEELDATDDSGYRRLRELLNSRRCRLYLGTVNKPPVDELIRIANESGGGVIQVAP